MKITPLKTSFFRPSLSIYIARVFSCAKWCQNGSIKINKMPLWQLCWGYNGHKVSKIGVGTRVDGYYVNQN